EAVSEETARAEVPLVAAGPQFGADPDDVLFHRLDRQEAAIAAVGADALGLLQLPRPVVVHRQPGGQRADGADLDAAAAIFALQLVMGEAADLVHRGAVERAERLGID